MPRGIYNRPPRNPDAAHRPRGVKVKAQKTEWMDKAKCSDRDDLGWVSEYDHADNRIIAIQLAKTFCAFCPVRGQCLQYGITTKSMGVWGGSYLAWEPRKRVVNLV